MLEEDGTPHPHAGLNKASRSKHPKKSSVFQQTARVEAIAVAGATATTSSKCFQALTQAFDQAGYSLSTV